MPVLGASRLRARWRVAGEGILEGIEIATDEGTVGDPMGGGAGAGAGASTKSRLRLVRYDAI